MINVVCGIRSTGRICTDLADALTEQGHTVKIAYGREDVPEKYKKYAGCIEEIAFDHGLIGSERLAALSSGMLNTDYGRHISMLAAQGMTL